MGITVDLTAAIALLLLCGQADAKVTGLCNNCHTMHDSQDDSALVQAGANGGWSGASQLTGGSAGSGCFKCHSTKDGI